jgi:hypothetical protein
MRIINLTKIKSTGNCIYKCGILNKIGNKSGLNCV